MMHRSPLKKSWKNQYAKISNQSNFHETVRMILCKDPPFNSMHCYQEVPVADICPDYPHPLHRFDWYIQELGVVIELHGQQHYQPTRWAKSESYADVMENFREGRRRDTAKEYAAKDAGYQYVVISYDEETSLSSDYIKTKLVEAHETLSDRSRSTSRHSRL